MSSRAVRANVAPHPLATASDLQPDEVEAVRDAVNPKAVYQR